jgi:hypothetical protein
MRTNKIDLNLDVVGGQGSLTTIEEKELSDFFRKSKVSVRERMPDETQYSYNRYMEYLSYKASEIFSLKSEAEDKVRKDEKIKLAENLILKNLDDQFTAEVTGLPLEEIKEIRDNLAKK